MEVPAIHAFMEKVVGISAGWTPGDQYVYFDVPCRITENYKLPAVKDIDLNKDYMQQKLEEQKPYTVRLSTPICFDDAFTDIMRPLFLNGCELFVNITDDSWSLKKSSEIQHFVIASYRAIEYRTTLIRSANAGYSVVVDPAGKVIADQPLFEESALVYDVPVYEHKMTTYARFGNWLPYLCLAVFVLCCLYAYFTFDEWDYIPSERKSKKEKKAEKKKKKNSKNQK
jgi:apolipoprotein N-acyltransferase